MNRIVLATALACAALAPWTPRVAAQPAMALGEPLPDGSMAVGTVTVRVIAGTPAAAVAGADVTLTVNGQPRVGKTDGSGRATFQDLPVGAMVQATILDEQQKPQTSRSFAVTATGGSRLMLSTKPFTGAPASHSPGAEMAGPQGAPEARAMSGQPRPDRTVEAGSYQVRLTYNNLTVANGVATDPQPPKDEKVTLVGYRSDNSVEILTQPLDAAGRATFAGLDVSGHTTYFALARLPRNGAVDRLLANPMVPDTQAGAKLILSSDKRDATTPPIDEASPQGIPTPAGKVRVSLEGIPVTAPVSLIDAVTKSVLATATPTPGPPDPSKVQGTAPFEAAADLPAGTIAIRVHGGPGNVDAGLPDVPIRVIPADQDNAEGVSSKTGPDGAVRMQVPVDKPHKAVLNINGRDLVSAPFDLSKSGGRLDVSVTWESKGRPEAVFDVPYGPDLVLYAEAKATIPESPREELFRSQPVQLIPGAGVHLAINVAPRVFIRFSKRADIEDEFLFVRGTYTIQNLSWIPYSAGADGMVVPLPKNFKGGRIAEEHQALASIAPNEGFRIVRPIPPGRTQVFLGYSLEAEDGVVDWELDIKQDMFRSGMEIRLLDDMTVKPRGAQGRTATATDGTQWFVLDDISIRAGRSMTMRITGLPEEPTWRVVVPRLVGLLVLGMLVAGILLAILRRPAAAAAPSGNKRSAALLDELVELERTGKDPARREQVLAELERLWRE